MWIGHGSDFEWREEGHISEFHFTVIFVKFRHDFDSEVIRFFQEIEAAIAKLPPSLSPRVFALTEGF